jgi:uncharacterized protein
MTKLFVDTGAFVAKEIAADQFHQAASQAWHEVERRGLRLFSSEHILDESATLIARRSHYAFAAEWGRDVLESGMEWLPADQADLANALILMRKYADQAVSFTDCLSAVRMKRAGLKDVFGFDHHFRSMGFRLWPGS